MAEEEFLAVFRGGHPPSYTPVKCKLKGGVLKYRRIGDMFWDWNSVEMTNFENIPFKRLKHTVKSEKRGEGDETWIREYDINLKRQPLLLDEESSKLKRENKVLKHRLNECLVELHSLRKRLGLLKDDDAWNKFVMEEVKRAADMKGKFASRGSDLIGRRAGR